MHYFKTVIKKINLKVKQKRIWKKLIQTKTIKDRRIMRGKSKERLYFNDGEKFELSNYIQ